MSQSARARNGDTPARILDAAEQLVQTRGFNGFSYADVAAQLGITKAALHYHFATKEELGEALIGRYAQRFCDALAGIDAHVTGAPPKLEAYAELYLGVLQDDRMCLCGMLAAEYGTLPESIRTTLIGFFDDNETWLEHVLNEGLAAHTLHFEGSASQMARTIVGSLEGAMLLARPYHDADRFQSTAAQLIGSLLEPAPAAGRSRRR